MIRQTIASQDDVMTFGKYKGRTVAWLIDNNPAYLLWLDNEKIVSLTDKLHDEALVSDMNQTPPEDFFWQPD